MFVVGIPTLKKYDLLDQCIQSILTTSSPLRIIVIDNGGKYACPYDDIVHVVRPLHNLGVARSWNMLHKLAYPHNLIIMNDDVKVTPGIIDKLLNAPQDFAHIGGWSCFKQKHIIWDIVGDYDENFYPAYFEDDDYSYRLRLADVKVAAIQGEVHHFGSATIKSMNELERQNFDHSFNKCREYYVKKWGGLPHEEKFVIPFNENINNSTKSVSAMRNIRYNKACNTGSDINEHLSVLYEYAKKCKHITEFGIGHGNSTTAFLHSQPQKLISYEINILPEVDDLKSLAGNTEFVVHNKSVLDVEIEETDLLFIDTYHTYEQLSKEFKLHAHKARKYIILHDTVTFGATGEHGGMGLWQAVLDFLQEKTFYIEKHLINNNGLTVLERL